jgi:hypothetical protein
MADAEGWMIPIRGLRAPVLPKPDPEPVVSRFRHRVARPKRVFWTQDMDARLEALWGTGAPSRAIAEQISEGAGRTVTHNAIISRAHRTGLASRRNPVPQ